MAKDEVERELAEIRVLLSKYIKSSSSNQEKRRVENIQILVALGIIGTYFTGFFQDFIEGSATSIETVLFFVVASSIIFLFFKIMIPSIRIALDSKKLAWFDELALHFLYMFSVLTGFMSVAYVSLPNLGIGITGYNNIVAVAILILGFFMSIYVVYQMIEHIGDSLMENDFIDNIVESSMTFYAERLLLEDLTDNLAVLSEAYSDLEVINIRDLDDKSSFDYLITTDKVDIPLEIKLSGITKGNAIALTSRTKRFQNKIKKIEEGKEGERPVNPVIVATSFTEPAKNHLKNSEISCVEVSVKEDSDKYKFEYRLL